MTGYVSFDGRLGAPAHRIPVATMAVIAVLVVTAWLNRFIQDDAFISFRYARNLADGHGLVWNPGETPVAGYSTFLWTVLIAAVFRIGIDPVIGAWTLGLVFFAGTLALTWRLTRDLLPDETAGRDARWVVVLLGTNYTFSAWATGGMETQLQAFLVVAAVLQTFRIGRAPIRPSLRRIGATSILFGLLLLTRLDSAVVVLVLGVYAALILVRCTTGHSLTRAGRVAALVGPGAFIVGGWLVWTASFYGDVLPNTYYVKVASSTSMFGGLHYIYRFLVEYWMVPLGLLLLAARPRMCLSVFARPADERHVVLLAILAAWALYLVRTGGDFMEFRFVVAVLPVLLVWLWCGVVTVVPESTVRRAVALTLVAGSAFHAMTFRGSLFGIESIDGIAVHMREEGGAWDEVGRSLGRYFGGPGSDVTLAVGAAGAIPYYSRLHSVDMRGLNDAFVARHGHIVGSTPGHQRMAPFEYLVDRGVTLVVGHPQISRRHEPLPDFLTVDALQGFGLVDATEALMPDDARFIVVPVARSLRVTVLYLTRSPQVDRVLEAGRLDVIPWRSLDPGSPAGITGRSRAIEGAR